MNIEQRFPAFPQSAPIDGADVEAEKSRRIRNVHIITRFDKGGSAENTFLTVTGLDPRRYETFLIVGGDGTPDAFGNAKKSGPDMGGNGTSDAGGAGVGDRRDATAHAGGKVRDSDVDAERAAAADNMEQARTRGVKTYVVPELVRPVDPVRDVRAFVRLRRLLRLIAPQIVHTHTSKAGIIGRMAAFSVRVPVIVHTPHGHVFWGYFGAAVSRFFIALEKIAARITDRLIMLTDQEKADHLHYRISPRDKFAVIPSGVCLEAFSGLEGNEHHPEDKPPAFPPGAFVIGTVGRLTAIKGQRYLLAAAAKLVREIPELLCVVVGEGEMRRELEEQAAALGMDERMIFPGWQRDVGDYMSAFDVFVMPSLNEGMGRVVVEAMAAGRAVIASDVGGLRNLVAPGENGLLVPPGDAEALAKAIRALYRDPERRRSMGEEGRKKAPAFSAGAMIMKIDELYKELLKKKQVPTAS